MNSEKRLIAFAKLIEPMHTGFVKPKEKKDRYIRAAMGR